MSDANRAHPRVRGLDGAILDLNHALTRAGPVFWVILYGIALILAIALGAVLFNSNARDREITRTDEELESTVRLLAKQFDGHIETFEAVPKSVAKFLAANSHSPRTFTEIAATERFHQFLSEKVSDTPDSAGVNIFDAEGNYINSSERWPVPRLNVSDRSYFQALKSKSDTAIIQLVDNRISAGHSILLVRKVTSSDGTLLGLVSRGIPPKGFESFFSTILPKDGSLALLHQDGTLLAQYPHSDEPTATRVFKAPLISDSSTEGQAHVQLDDMIDRQDFLARAVRLEHYPIYVAATKSTAAALVGWARETRTLAVLAVLAAIVVGLMLVAIVKTLKEQHRRLNIAISNMAQGLLLFDSSERLLLCNQRYLDLFGLSPDVVKPGRKLRDIIEHKKERGTLTGDVDEYCDNARVGYRTGISSLSKTPDGRWVKILNKAVQGGGWVATIEDVTEQRRNEEQAVRLASYDVLTELPNRALLRSHLQNELEHCSDENQVAVLFLDMDDFKAVNDTLGHFVGDDLLKSVARCLQASAGPNAFVARLGGDEFALVVSQIQSESQIISIVETIYDAVRRPHECVSHQINVDTSIGIALAPGHGSTCDELLQNADLAMYDAKSSGKRTYRIFEPRLEKTARDRREIEIDLRKALDAGSIDVNYQPIVDLQTHKIVGCEALARWSHEERGIVSPAEFIPVAERSGLIEELGEYVLNAACQQATKWPSGTKVAVNVSPVQFKSGTFALKVVTALTKSGLPPHCLELEITEAVLIDDDDAALKVLHELKSIGVRIALDDFGTGYSSLRYLHRFPFDKIKIDKSFVDRLTTEDGSAAIVRAVVNIATEYKMATTAEGVETVQQWEILRDLNCSQMQGYLFSRPRPGSEVMKMLSNGDWRSSAA